MPKLKLSVVFPLPPLDVKYDGFLGWWATIEGFCQNFADVVAPLTDLLRPKRPFEWSQQCQCAFDNTKSLLVNAPVLMAPNFERSFLVAVVLMVLGLFFCKRTLRELNIQSAIFQENVIVMVSKCILPWKKRL